MYCGKKIDFHWEIFTYLKYLNLENITEIHLTNSTENFKIINLRISFTKTIILKDILKTFKNLVKLNLSGNFLENFQQNEFIRNTNLINNLDLSKNSLEYLNKLSFSNLKNLYFLNLSENRIEKIPSFTFFHLTKLEELYISNNFCKLELEEKSFRSLKKLKILHLQSEISYHATKYYFYHLISLKTAYFQLNKFCCILKDLKIVETCLFEFKSIKICNLHKSISKFIIFILFSTSFYLFLYIISELFVSFIIFNNFNFKINFLSRLSNLSLFLYIFFLFLHFAIHNFYSDYNNIKIIAFGNLLCLQAKHLYHFILILNIFIYFFENCNSTYTRKYKKIFLYIVSFCFFVIFLSLFMFELLFSKVIKILIKRNKKTMRNDIII